MASATPQPVFSVPFRHLKSTYFLDENSVNDQRPNGLMRFVGDEPNQILKYLVTTQSGTVNSSSSNAELQIQWPLVLFGPSGTGKTSLALSIMTQLADRTVSESTTKPIFMSALDFDRRYRSALETDSVDDFRTRLSDSCGIVIDDVQKLTSKPAAQNELVLILDDLAQKNLPIIITLDDPPLKLTGLSVQLVSRLCGGLSLPVNPPGPLARREIVLDLAQINGITLTPDALDLLVDQLKVTVPKLVHFFAQTKAKLRADEDVSDEPISSSNLTRMFQKSDQDVDQMASHIIEEVAGEFHLKPNEIKSNSRKQSIVLARGIAIYLFRSMLGLSFLKIGSYFGNRDHSTVMHSYRKIQKLVDQQSASNATTLETIDRLKQKLSEQFASQINFL